MPRGLPFRTLLLVLASSCTGKLAPEGPGPIHDATGRLDANGDVFQLVGGVNDSGPQSAAWGLDIPHREWVRIDGPTENLHSATSVRLEDTVWIFGGTTTDGSETSGLVQWPTLAGAWTPQSIRGDVPPPRRNATWVSVSTTQAVLIGGHNNDFEGSETTFGDVWGFDSDAAAFTEVDTTDGPIGLQRHAAAHDGTRIWVHGGIDPEGERSNRLWALDTATWTWTEHASDGAPGARTDHFMAWWDDRLVLWGGAESDPQVWTYTPDTATWNAVDMGGPSPRNGFAWDTVEGEPWAILIGGAGFGDLGNLSDIWALNLETLEWSELQQTDGTSF